jgi:predicted phage baseplate assembly protein
VVSHVEHWHREGSYSSTTADDKEFRIDPAAGRVAFPPAVRRPDGTVDQRGAVPPAGAVLRIAAYAHGGGRLGNVSANTLVVVKSSVPSVARCENRRPADGGVDGETLDAAKKRAPLALRSRDRAVTAEDFEYHTRQSAREIARAHCEVRPDEAGLVRVLVVPHVADDARQPGGFALEQLRPRDETLAAVQQNLEQRRLVGTRVLVEPPLYQGATVLARVRAWRTAELQAVQRNATAAVYRYVHPVFGGPYGDGWPFGRPLTAGEIHAVLAGVPGVDFVEDVLLFGVDLATNQRAAQPSNRLELSRGALFYSVGHQVRVEATP